MSAGLTTILREAIRTQSLCAIERATGVKRQSLGKFLRGGSLRLDNADRLSSHFGIVCQLETKQSGFPSMDLAALAPRIS